MTKKSKIVNSILSDYEAILQNKKFVFEEMTMTKLSDTDYGNLKVDNDGTKNDSVNKALLDDINAAAKAAGITATITTAVSGHGSSVDDATSSSRHPQGIAVDIAILNGIGSDNATNSTNGNADFRTFGNKLKDALVDLGYVWNVESGNDKAVLWQTNTGGNHFNHLHVSNKTETSSSPSSTTDTNVGTDSSSRNRQFISRIAEPILKSVGITESSRFIKDVKRIKELLK